MICSTLVGTESRVVVGSTSDVIGLLLSSLIIKSVVVLPKFFFFE
jgi:hypothetical protein